MNSLKQSKHQFLDFWSFFFLFCFLADLQWTIIICRSLSMKKIENKIVLLTCNPHQWWNGNTLRNFSSCSAFFHIIFVIMCKKVKKKYYNQIGFHNTCLFHLLYVFFAVVDIIVPPTTSHYNFYFKKIEIKISSSIKYNWKQQLNVAYFLNLNFHFHLTTILDKLVYFSNSRLA